MLAPTRPKKATRNLVSSIVSVMSEPAIEFEATGTKLHLIYRPHTGTAWLYKKFKRGETVILKGTFHLTRENLVHDDVDDWVDGEGFELPGDPDDFEIGGEDRVDFIVARASGQYFRFDPNVLRVGVPVLLHRKTEPTWKWFSAERKTSILDVVAQLRPSRIAIGGPAADAIPQEEYEKLIVQFPTTHELKRYVVARVSGVVREYTDATVDAEAQLRTTVSRKIKGAPRDLAAPFREADAQKFKFLHNHLRGMLAQPGGYNEAQWQGEIIKIVCLLNPKYIEAFTSVRVRDFDYDTWRFLDILLVDASGNVDVVEIKQPFAEAMITGTRYRNNHVPMRELSGTVMQLEKYLLHLSRWGAPGEQVLTKRYVKRLPRDFRIRIVNPSGLVIMGRDDDMTETQRRDFELVRRHYRHIADIVTYDDLLRRLEVILNRLRAEF